MNNSPGSDRCNQLRKLHARVTNEVKLLRESVQKAEHDGVGNPVEMLSTIKSLEASLRTINLELEKCPPEHSDVSSSSLLHTADVSTAEQQVRRWFPDSEQNDSELELDDEPI